MLDGQLASTPPDDLADHRPTSEESASYEAVRDSWVEAPRVVIEAPASDPPALPASIRETPGERAPREAELADRMLERMAAGDDAGALLAAESLLRLSPRDADALDCAEMSRSALVKVYESRLGALDRVPTIVLPPSEISALSLDVFAGFILSRIDGLTSLAEIVSAHGMAPERALRVLSELYLAGVIALSSRDAPVEP